MKGKEKKISIVAVSNFINHHQAPLADVLASRDDVDYHFIQRMPMPEEFIQRGYPDYSNRAYIIKSYADKENQRKAQELIDNADVVIFGDAPEDWLRNRLKNNKLTFHSSERWFKTGSWRLLSPRAILYQYKYHFKYRNKPSYMLCKGAFVSKDCKKAFAYVNKCFKWAYFVDVPELNIEKILKSKSASDKIKILYVARFIDWKHPEMAVALAWALRNKGYDFEINMFGDGPQIEKIKNLIFRNGLNDNVRIKGTVPNKYILQLMQEHHVFLFTSDRNEGWGAVAAEAMSNGCVVVAGDKIGCVPYLIKSGDNGLIFKDRNVKDLTDKIIYLIKNPPMREKMAYNAYKTMRDEWSPKNGAEALLKLIKNMQNGKIEYAHHGPCSKA